MKLPLTVQMLVRDNETTIERCLESLRPLEFDVIVGDMRSKDRTPGLCSGLGARFVRMTNRHDLSSVRSELAKLSKSPWNLWVCPNERMLRGHDELVEAVLGPPSILTVNLIQGSLLTKPARLWHRDSGFSFSNRAFEVLTGPSKHSDAYLSASATQPPGDTLEICNRWHSDMPLLPEPIYYLACAHLQAGNVGSFMNYADSYLHAESKRQMSYFMTKYHMGLVQCYKTKDFRSCLRNAIECLAEQPTMAEFWCLVGDAYYEMGDFGKAKTFYENAVVMGRRRTAASKWPMYMDKYRDHPERMIESCGRIASETKAYGGSISK